MQNKVVVRFDFDANTVLTAWFCCNMSRTPLDIFSGANNALLVAAFLWRGRHFQVNGHHNSWGSNV
jgi:hypothetical protein